MTVPAPNLDLALVGNCAIGALIDRQGSIVWCCMPRFDGDPVFNELLNSGGESSTSARFGIELEGFVRSEQAYDPGTAIVRTRLFDAKDRADARGKPLSIGHLKTPLHPGERLRFRHDHSVLSGKHFRQSPSRR